MPSRVDSLLDKEASVFFVYDLEATDTTVGQGSDIGRRVPRLLHSRPYLSKSAVHSLLSSLL